MQHATHILTIEVPIRIAAKTGINACLTQGEQSLEDASYPEEGRLCYDMETLERALDSLMRQAVKDSVRRFFEQKHGSKMEPLPGGGAVRTSHKLTEEWMKTDFGGAVPQMCKATFKLRRSENV